MSSKETGELDLAHASETNGGTAAHEAKTAPEAGVSENPAQNSPHPPETPPEDAGETEKEPGAENEDVSENAEDGGDEKDSEDKESAGDREGAANKEDSENAEDAENTEDSEDAEEAGDEEDSENEEEAGDGEGSEGGVMTLGDHLRDLRSCLFKSFLWLIAGFCICYPFHEELFALLFAPLIAVMPEGAKLVYLSPPEAFFTYMKIAVVAGLFLTSPMVFYHLWAFIAPGLYREEKMRILPAAFFSAFFFVSGGLFCYFVVFEVAFKFFMSYNKGNVQAMPAMDETLSFVLQFLLAFGVVFELPLFAFLLARIGLISADALRRFRRYAILIMVIVAAILTPPDVVSQLLMAGPLILLYEMSILIAAFFGKKRADTDAESGEND
ncbi:MAG: twin-arginine translocase subunit TatC [Desulfovibrio sp.]|nr:twin-arginine translocase subunit TatC [Desulfovibrio sp.]